MVIFNVDGVLVQASDIKKKEGFRVNHAMCRTMHKVRVVCVGIKEFPVREPRHMSSPYMCHLHDGT